MSRQAITSLTLGRTPLRTLQRFVRKIGDRVEVCELCAQPIPQVHPHLFELDKRRVTCACEACSILFDGNTRQRYRRIPRDVYRLPNFVMDDHEWDSLMIPINLAFFVYSSSAKRMVAQYPNPGGVMESSLDLEYWEVIAERNPILKKLEPDVEALLVNRIGDSPQYFRVPIDQCFNLVGIIRIHWHGLSGGEQVWKEIDSFFRELTARAGA
jgi:Family of unknown function (DUF5947)